MRTTDNNLGKHYLDEIQVSVFKNIANKKISELVSENPNLLVFPHVLGSHDDDIAHQNIFSINLENNLTTYNTMGFVGINDTQLTITSRFAKDDENDYFLHYMLQKVFAINLFKFDLSNSKENVWDFLLYLFPFYLKKALAQGLYKEYKWMHYNDSNLKGAIEVSRHIRMNNPFMGKISYKTKEHAYDNSITQLVRHTIEYIKTHKYCKGILSNDSETTSCVNLIEFNTPSYLSGNKQKVLMQNLKPFRHPYFSEYKMLQKICLQILRYEKLSFGREKDKIYGILFDGAWLWEEYLNTLLKDKFIHPKNKTKTGVQYLFEEKQQEIYPDFISKERVDRIVADAKYKGIGYGVKEDYYQILTYMFRFSSKKGFLIYPYKQISESIILKIKETDNILTKMGVAIPQEKISFDDSIEDIKNSEVLFLKNINQITEPCSNN